MKRLTFIFLFVLTVLVQPASAQEWKNFSDGIARCSFQLPDSPKIETRILNHPAFGEMPTHIYMLQPEKEDNDPNVLYTVSYTDYPAASVHSDSVNQLTQFFNSARDGALANVQGKLLLETVINLSGYPGREIRVDFKEGLALIRVRNYLVKNRIYCLQVITLTANNFNMAINHFFDSFKLIQ